MMKFVNFFYLKGWFFSVENYYRAVIKGKRTFLNELVNLKFLLESFGKKLLCVSFKTQRTFKAFRKSCVVNSPIFLFETFGF